MSEHPTDAHFLFTFVFKQALTIVIKHPLKISRSGGEKPDGCLADKAAGQPSLEYCVVMTFSINR